MGNSLHIVYFIDMKNMHGKAHEKWRGKYKRLSYVSNKNKNSEHSSTKDTPKDTPKDMIPKNENLDEDKNLQKWLEYVECW